MIVFTTTMTFFFSEHIAQSVHCLSKFTHSSNTQVLSEHGFHFFGKVSHRVNSQLINKEINNLWDLIISWLFTAKSSFQIITEH
jgi:hypothetical protein